MSTYQNILNDKIV
nr:neurotoxin type B Hn+ 35 kda subunit=band 3b [Clostridium botulinum, type B, Peptide Partial, 13 aa] [Clostridium botulinum]